MTQNPFYVEPQNNYLPGLQALGNSIARYGEIKRQQEKQELEKSTIEKAEKRIEELRQGATEAIQSGDPEQMHKFAAANPEWNQAMNGFMQWSSEGSRKNYLMSAAELRSNPTEENAKKVLESRQQYLQSIGAKHTEQTDSFLEKFMADPDPAKTEAIKGLDMSVASVATKDEWNQYKEAAGIEEPKSISSTPLTTMGKINRDFIEGNITKEEYDDLRYQQTTEGKYAPSGMEKQLDLYNRVITEKGKDSFEAKSIEKKLMGADYQAEELTPEALLFFGTQLEATGKMPSFGMGRGALNTRVKISNTAAKLGYIKEMKKQGIEIPEEYALSDTDTDTVAAAINSIETQTNVKAIQGSMNFLEKQRASMDSFVKNLTEQIGAVKEIAKEIELTDISLLNKPWRSIRRHLGTASQNKYDMFIAEISRETGKLSQSATQSIASMPEGEVRRWEEIHDKNLSMPKMLELLESTAKAADIRMNSVDTAIANAKTRLQSAAKGTGAQIPGVSSTESKVTPHSWRDYK